MRIYYDFHIHTALSPCGDNEMTPNNIVNMAALKELDCIAITDHNTYGNVKAVIDAVNNHGLKLIVLPGMEAETSEEIHTLCLFSNLESVESFGKYIYSNLPDIDNQPRIFGEQTFYDEFDNPIKTEKKLLLSATTIDLYTMVKKAKEYGGVCIPAHIDRPSYGILATLGFIPPDLEINAIEVSKHVDPIQYLFENKKLIGRKLPYLQSSDAHYLWDISEKNRFLDIDTDNISAEQILNCIKNL